MKRLFILFSVLCCLVLDKKINAMEGNDLKNAIAAAYNGNVDNFKIYIALANDPNQYLAPENHDIDTGKVKYDLNALSAAIFTKHNNIYDILLNPTENITLEKPINVNEASPDEGYTPLFFSILGNNPDGMEVLLTAGANVDIVDKNGNNTPLIKASSMPIVGDNPVFVEKLLAKNANPNAQNTNKDTALSLAILTKHIAIATKLIPVTDLKLADKNGNTPLHQAAYLGLDEIVKLLIEKGADLNATNNAGKTALQLAEKRNKTSTVEILTQAMRPSTTPIITIPTTTEEPELTKSLNSLQQALNELEAKLS